METFAAMDIAQRPFRHLRTFARQRTVGGDDFVRRTDEHSIVHGSSDRRAERRLVLHTVIIQYGLVILRQFGRQGVTSFFQMDNLRSRRRQPQVLHLDDILPIDGKVVATGHLLTNVQQQSIIACFRNINGCFEDVTLAHFTLVSFGGSDVDDIGSGTC